MRFTDPFPSVTHNVGSQDPQFYSEKLGPPHTHLRGASKHTLLCCTCQTSIELTDELLSVELAAFCVVSVDSAYLSMPVLIAHFASVSIHMHEACCCSDVHPSPILDMLPSNCVHTASSCCSLAGECKQRKRAAPKGFRLGKLHCQLWVNAMMHRSS